MWGCRDGSATVGGLAADSSQNRTSAGTSASEQFWMRSAARSRKLSFSIRSPDRGAPFFWNGAPSPTARSITTSSMTPPDRPDGTARMAFCEAYSKQSSASAMVPTWLGFRMKPSTAEVFTARSRRSGLVTIRSSPRMIERSMVWTAVVKPSQSSPPRPPAHRSMCMSACTGRKSRSTHSPMRTP
jgi:hypothetical protein